MCYPPGIPILAPGERITKEIAEYILYAKEKGCSMPVSYTHLDVYKRQDTEFVDAHALTVAVKRLRDKLEDDTQKPESVSYTHL